MSESDSDDIVSAEVAKSKSTHLLVTLEGKDARIWSRTESRFVQRLLNAAKAIQNADIRPNKKAAQDLRSGDLAALARAKATLAKPQIENVDRSANIKVALEKTLESDNTIDSESNDDEIQSVHESQRIIERLIQKGEIVIVEEDGVTYVAYNRK